MAGNMAEWAMLVNDYYGADLDDTTAKRWSREIRKDCPNASPQDVIDAIKLHKNDELRRKVNMGDIIRWVRAIAPQEAKDLRSCALCHKGLIEVRPDLPSGEFTLDEYSRDYLMTVPCLCASGRYRMDAMKFDSYAADMSGLRQKAMVQRKEYFRLIEEVASSKVSKVVSEVDFQEAI